MKSLFYRPFFSSIVNYAVYYYHFFTIFEWVKSPNEYFRDFSLYIPKRGINPLSYPRKPHWSLTWPQSPIYKKPAVSFMLNTLDPIYFSYSIYLLKLTIRKKWDLMIYQEISLSTLFMV